MGWPQILMEINERMRNPDCGDSNNGELWSHFPIYPAGVRISQWENNMVTTMAGALGTSEWNLRRCIRDTYALASRLNPQDANNLLPTILTEAYFNNLKALTGELTLWSDDTRQGCSLFTDFLIWACPFSSTGQRSFQTARSLMKQSTMAEPALQRIRGLFTIFSFAWEMWLHSLITAYCPSWHTRKITELIMRTAPQSRPTETQPKPGAKVDWAAIKWEGQMAAEGIWPEVYDNAHSGGTFDLLQTLLNMIDREISTIAPAATTEITTAINAADSTIAAQALEIRAMSTLAQVVAFTKRDKGNLQKYQLKEPMTLRPETVSPLETTTMVSVHVRFSANEMPPPDMDHAFSRRALLGIWLGASCFSRQCQYNSLVDIWTRGVDLTKLLGANGFPVHLFTRRPASEGNGTDTKGAVANANDFLPTISAWTSPTDAQLPHVPARKQGRHPRCIDDLDGRDHNRSC
jgi:hypothetical protein